MSANSNLNCPVDFITINEYQARLVALQVFGFSVLVITSQNLFIIGLLAVDFLLRAFNFGKYSPLGWVAKTAIQVLSIGEKPVDQAPKRFAATIGLMLSAGMLASYFSPYPTIALGIAALLCVFSFLESFFAFCAGCHVYTLLGKVGWVKS